MFAKKTMAAGLLCGMLAAGPALAQARGQAPKSSQTEPSSAPAATGARSSHGSLRGQPASSHDGQGSAYFEFVRGRHFEGLGQVEEALAAYQRAAKLDPGSAEIRAEMAALYARQNQPDEAIDAAKAALKLDPDDSEAHWVLGTVYAALADSREEEEDAAVGPGGSAPPPPLPPPPTSSSGSSAGAGADAGTPSGAASASSIDKEEPSLAAAIAHLEKARPERLYDNGLHLTLGRLYLETENYDKAVSVLYYVVEREPDFVEAAFLLAQAYDGAGKRTQAIQTLEELVTAEPQFSRAWALLADLYGRTRQWDKSAQAYDRAAADNPQAVDLRLRQAAMLATAGRASAARDILQGVAKANPNDARVLYLLAETQRSVQDLDGAEATARQLMTVAPKQPYGVHALAQVYAQRHQYREIVTTLEPVVQAGGAMSATRAYAPLWVSLGQAYEELGQYDKAVDAFEHAKKVGGNDPSYDAYLAQAYLAAQKPKEALPLITALRERQPKNLRLLNLEAEARVQSGDVAGGTKLLEDARAANPKDPQLPVALAALYVGAKQFAKAEQVLNEAAAEFPADIGIPFQQGAVLDELKRPAEAEKAFRRALAIDPQHAPTLNYLGYMLAEHGTRLDEAVKLLTQAVQIEPFNGSYLDSLGWAYFKKGELDKAREYLIKAGEQMPANSVVQDHVGDLLFAQRDVDGAIAAWKRALSGDGHSIDRQAIERKIDRALKK